MYLFYSIPIEHVSADLALHDPSLARFDWNAAIATSEVYSGSVKDWFYTEASRRGQFCFLNTIHFKARHGPSLDLLTLRHVGRGLETIPAASHPQSVFLLFAPKPCRDGQYSCCATSSFGLGSRDLF
jgi:hypothetical protein